MSSGILARRNGPFAGCDQRAIAGFLGFPGVASCPGTALAVVGATGGFDMNKQTGQHVFSHLGEAPFKLVGYTKNHASCDHCATAIVHNFHIESADGKSFKVGSSCVDKTGDGNLISEVKTTKRNAIREAKQATKKQGWRRAAWAKIRVQLTEDPDLSAALRTDHHIVQDIRNNFIKWGSLSDKQVALVKKLAVDVPIQKKQQADMDARKIAVPEGKHTVTGTVVSTKYVDNHFGYGTSVFKMLVLVETEDGLFKVFGTCPAKLETMYTTDEYGCQHNVEVKGMKIELTATFERSGDDESFGFFKRPKVVIL